MVGTAQQDGKVTRVDQEAGMVEVTYKDGSKDVFEFGSKLTAFSGFYMDQNLILNVKLGQQVKQNDIITYNKNYFIKDHSTNQVDMSIGILANVAFLEMDLTLEDSCAITKSFGERLAITPVNIRTIVLKKNSVIYNYAKIGDMVNITSDLMVFDEEAIEGTDVFTTTDQETIEMMAELNRKTPSAKFSGEIVAMNAYSTVPIADMHPSLQKVVREAVAKKNKQAKFTKDTLNENEYPGFQLMQEGSKYLGITFDPGTVVIVYLIKEYIPQSLGDKISFQSQLKTTVGYVFDKDISTESGVNIDALFSTNAAERRVTISYMKGGILSRICEKIENDALDMYFK